MKNIFLFILLLSASSTVAQPQQFTLEDVVQLAKAQSISGKQAATQKQTSYWQYRTFQAGFKPQLSLNGSLPNFQRSFTQVTQPDGTISFQPISNNNSILNLALTQNIALTGGSVFVQKQIQRFDDFQRNNRLYNGIPFAFGITQPLFQFNAMKWDRKIEPLKYEESTQFYIESMEKVTVLATGYYFDLLVAQVNLQIAEKNLSNNDTLYKIAQHKLELGKISQNDILQLQMSVLTAKKEFASARQNAEIASLSLRSYMGYRDDRKLELVVPSRINELTINVENAIKEAFSNRSDAIAFRRRALEAQRDVDKARKDNGLNATLQAAFGLSNRGANLGDIYIRPQDREYLEIQFVLPIMTWGRAQARTETAKANQQLTTQAVEQDKLTFEQAIYTQVTLLQMLQQQVKLTAEADGIGQQRYQIAQNRFILSDLSVTDLGIAMQEKDRARRDAILALRDYWTAFYTIRLLTLYDFERNEKIKY
ncbi:TolC family protein [Larkinella rosea]|uniref:TolC family protein n=1 Tax=Larkinella rosea TaxID=2025312 RepID=A0A3P1BN77_9BACT|nr:TolC family protein [Larkinella rosea]RRB02519.1 TolC family protein [Larkinella rosea]